MYVIIEFDPDKKTAHLVLDNSGETKIFESYTGSNSAYNYVCNNIDGAYKIISLGRDNMTITGCHSSK